MEARHESIVLCFQSTWIDETVAFINLVLKSYCFSRYLNTTWIQMTTFNSISYLGTWIFINMKVGKTCEWQPAASEYGLLIPLRRVLCADTVLGASGRQQLSTRLSVCPNRTMLTPSFLKQKAGTVRYASRCIICWLKVKLSLGRNVMLHSFESLVLT